MPRSTTIDLSAPQLELLTNGLTQLSMTATEEHFADIIGLRSQLEQKLSQIQVRDRLGVAIQVGDIVYISAYGNNVRLIDTGKTGRVTEITSRGNLQLDNPEIANGTSGRRDYLTVMRRDGAKGYEGNRER